jgi:uncharacterized protein (TIGR04255 family)
MRQRDLGSAAPITEALLDLHVRFDREVDTEELERLHDRVREQYPTRKQRFQVEVKLDLESGSAVLPDSRRVGFFFWAGDERQAMQARIDGFAFSRLSPYQSWESLRDEAQRLWRVYREFSRPATITRTALRYINRIRLPFPLEFEDYLATFPRLGPGYPNALAGYLMRIVAPYQGATVAVTQAIDQAGITDSVVPIILDIEVARTVEIPARDDDACWRALDELRAVKNSIFFGSLTDKADELFRKGADR